MNGQIEKAQRERDMLERLANAELEDLIEDPARFGLPTMAEFMRDPDKWRGSPEDTFISLSDGSQLLKRIRRHIYYVAGEKTESLERVQRICQDEGWNDVSYIPDLRKDEQGRLEVHFEVLPKHLAEEKSRALQVERAIKGAGINPHEVGSR